jgi:hypothetical protein
MGVDEPPFDQRAHLASTFPPLPPGSPRRRVDALLPYAEQEPLVSPEERRRRTSR